VQAYQWVDIKSLRQLISQHPNFYTPWLLQAFEISLTNKDFIKENT